MYPCLYSHQSRSKLPSEWLRVKPKQNRTIFVITILWSSFAEANLWSQLTAGTLFFLLQKALLFHCFLMFHSLGVCWGVWKTAYWLQGEAQAEALTPRWCRGPHPPPPKGCWTPDVLVVLESGPSLEEMFAQPSLGAASLLMLLGWLPLSDSRKWFWYQHKSGCWTHSEAKETETISTQSWDRDRLIAGPCKKNGCLCPPSPKFPEGF